MEDTLPSLDWSLLLPDFSLRLVDGAFTAQDLSAYIIFVFGLVAVVGLGILVRRAAAATKTTDFFLDLLEGIAPEELVAKRHAIRVAARKAEHEGALWSRFDRTLVVSGGGDALYSSQDCASVFNVRSIVKNPVDSRLLAALPGILTSMGILGTVLVLQLGVNDVSSAGAGASSANALVDRVAVAFSASVWGVGASVLLQLSNYGIDWLLRWRIGYLCQRIERLFPRLENSHLLVKLDHYDGQEEVTHTTLNSLVDGHLRNTLDAMAEDVQSGVRQALGPALDRLGLVSEELATRRHADAIEAMVGEQRGRLESLGSEAAAVLANVDAGLANLSQGLDRHTSMAEQHAAASEQRIQDLENLQRSVLEKVDSVLQITLEGTEQFVVQAGQTKQRDKATRDLIHELDTARYNIEHTVDELKRRAQSSNRTLDQLEVGYTAFLDGLSDSAADSGARMSNLLIEYSQQMSEQARERLDDGKQMTEEFSAAMAVGLEQMRATLPEARPPKKRAAARRKSAPVPKQAAKKRR